MAKKEKNIYRESRESAGFTREAAAEQLVFISEDRLERIENEKSAPHPDEIEIMAKTYKNPALYNYYCANECPLGQNRVQEIELKDLSQITLEILDTINRLSRQKDRLVEIAVDGNISREELKDFINIREDLNKMARTIDSLKLWLDHDSYKKDQDDECYDDQIEVME